MWARYTHKKIGVSLFDTEEALCEAVNVLHGHREVGERLKQHAERHRQGLYAKKEERWNKRDTPSVSSFRFA
jgi:hypothetical protein